MSTASKPMRIGEVAEHLDLSLRTIRHYDEVGLVPPSARSEGGFRLYTEPDVARLELVKRMKPLGFTLGEMRDLLDTLDALETSGADDPALLERLGAFRDTANARVQALRRELTTAEGFAATLDEHAARPRAAPEALPSAGRR